MKNNASFRDTFDITEKDIRDVKQIWIFKKSD